MIKQSVPLGFIDAAQSAALWLQLFLGSIVAVC